MDRSTLQDELKKREPFACPEQEVHLNLARTAERLEAPFAALFRGRGLSGSQYNVLRILRGEGAELPCQEVSARMVSSTPDVTRLVDRLEAAGLVERRRTPEDRRVVLLKITPAGLAVLAELDEPLLELHRGQLAHMTPAELAELNRLLVKARRPG